MTSNAFTDEQLAAANHNTYLIEALMDAIKQCKQWPVTDPHYGAVQEQAVLWQAAVHRAVNE